MRILIENSSNQLQNLGDVAMLQVAYSRLRLRWPEAELVIITENAQRLSEFLEAARAGVPAVAPGVDGIPEVIEDGRTGVLLQPRHPASACSDLPRAS